MLTQCLTQNDDSARLTTADKTRLILTNEKKTPTYQNA